MSNESVQDLVNKIWLNTEDIQKLCNCSRNSAMAIRKEVEEKVKESGKRLPTARCKVVPTMLVLDYLGIDVDIVLNISTKQKGMLKATK